MWKNRHKKSRNLHPVVEGLKTCSLDDIPREKLPRSTKLHVLYYLSNNDFRGLNVLGHRTSNVFTGEVINAYGTVLSDKEYIWDDDLWIYVRDYDLKLPEKFIEKVEHFFNEGHAINPIKGAKEPPLDGRPFAYFFED